MQNTYIDIPSVCISCFLDLGSEVYVQSTLYSMFISARVSSAYWHTVNINWITPCLEYSIAHVFIT